MFDKRSVVVFDLDDTLYNEIDFLKSAYRHIAKYIEKSNWQLLYVKMIAWYRLDKNVFALLSELYNLDKNILLSLYRHHEPDIFIPDGINLFLKQLKIDCHSIHLITDGRSITQRNKLKSLGLSTYFDKVIISEEFGSEKNMGISFKYLNDSYKCFNLYYIGDNVKKDFFYPNNFEWTTIGIIDNMKNIHVNNIEDYPKEYHPTIFIENLIELK